MDHKPTNFDFDEDLESPSSDLSDTLMRSLSTSQYSDPEHDASPLSAEDREQIRLWNHALPARSQLCLHQLIEDMVVRQPEAEAICSWDGELTYEELDEHAKLLAAHLRARVALKPDDIVLLYFEKSVWVVVAAYAVMKAGGAYGFLGVTDPLARTERIVDQAKAKAILTSPHLYPRISSLNVPVTQVEELMFYGDMPERHDAWQQPASHIDALAYVLFTSGSTGVPKMVMIDHGAAATSALEHGAREEVGPSSRVFQFAAYTFDVSTSEMFTTLCMGGCICIPSEDDRQGNVAASMNELGVNHAFLTPTVAGLLSPGEVPDLKILNLGGESLTAANLATWAPYTQLGNSYGPCEASIRSAFRADLTASDDPNNCGHAVGCALWISHLDSPDELVPVGAIGELCIEGPTLARGYMGDAAATTKSFVAPSYLEVLFPERPCRVYRTGDLAQYAEDGTVRVLGRKDTQVKIRGQRVELAEIENAISSILDLDRSGAVLFPTSGAYAGRLIGVVGLGVGSVMGTSVGKMTHSVPLEDVHPRGRADLENKLSAVLPAHMVPLSWVALSELPLNASSKLDRKSILSLIANGIVDVLSE